MLLRCRHLSAVLCRPRRVGGRSGRHGLDLDPFLTVAFNVGIDGKRTTAQPSGPYRVYYAYAHRCCGERS